MRRKRTAEPRYLICEECGAFLGPVEENSPATAVSVVKGRTCHAPALVLHRSEVRERLGDQTALEALWLLRRHRES